MTQVQESSPGVHRAPNGATVENNLLGKARARVAREKDLSTSSHTAHYAPASLGQSPYVSLPGMGTVVLRKCGWGC